MRTGAPSGHAGYFHETAFYGSDAGFRDLVVPFLDEGVAHGEPVLVACGTANQRLLREAVSDPSGVVFVPRTEQYDRPTEAIIAYRKLFAEYAGAPQIRVVGEVPHPGTGASWDWWARYEAAVNQVFAEFPLWGLCPYDLRTTPAGVLVDVLRTHPHVTGADGGHAANPDYSASWTWPDIAPDPLQAVPPTVALTDPSPAEARRAVTAAASTTGLTGDERDDIVYATSEAVTNALCHGKPPVSVRAWAGRARLVVAVTDRGTGPSSPLAGLVPTTDTTSAGIGLWLTHRTCRDVALARDDEGYTIRLTVGS
ncbi:sensor histidine kinase [Saccharothrix longispora]|uniref:sensor histidine kinase n=1 Tax=Saccharothrix longispora TaxID=33920 RepID=UPI0028FD2398|nr:sensor histidine kinase [Saccharothrix longispora]MBY8847671.1 sensor histidine kinase [Saccharothrix sp. MB29]MDU0288445.1 sensor histidine kinase [Saccharothrix longispora]